MTILTTSKLLDLIGLVRLIGLFKLKPFRSQGSLYPTLGAVPSGTAVQYSRISLSHWVESTLDDKLNVSRPAGINGAKRFRDCQ